MCISVRDTRGGGREGGRKGGERGLTAAVALEY